MSTKTFVVAANWKMHKAPQEAVDFLRELLLRAEARPSSNELIFFLPALDLWAAREILTAAKVGWGAQNIYPAVKGAFTGENSPAVLAQIGATHALVGHSERRSLFGETDADCARKVKALQDLGLTPVLCVGETLAEREAGRTNEVIVRQLHAGLKDADPKKKLLIAYEPVWAIGTGKVATPQQANEAHEVLRRELVNTRLEATPEQIPILYGGSVKPDNAAELARLGEVDGFLVGGAALEIETFLPLCVVHGA